MSLKKKHISVSGIVFINVTALIGVRWFASGAIYGAESFALWILAALLFFVPIAMICADFSSMYPEVKGGIIGWIREELGEKHAYYASWMYYSSYCLLYPSGLSFMAIALGYALNFHITKGYITVIVLISIWLVIGNCLFGMQLVVRLSKFGGVIGKFIPVMLLIFLGVISVVFMKYPIPTDFSIHNWLPEFNLDKVIYLSTLTFAISGIEMSSAFASSMKNPKKEYPKAILLSAIAVLIIYMAGSFAMLLIESPSKIHMSDGILSVIITEARHCNILWLGKIICLCIAVSIIAELTAVMGSNLKLFMEGNSNAIPAFLLKENRRSVQQLFLLIQGIILSVFVLLSNFMPTVELLYLVLVMMTTVLMFIPYFYLLIAYVKVKLKKTKNGIAMPLGNFLPILGSVVCFITVSGTIIIPIVLPPDGSVLPYELQVIGGPFFFIVLGWILHKLRPKKEVNS